MVGDGDVHDASTLMREDQQHEQESARCRQHDEEISSRDLMDVIRQEPNARSSQPRGPTRIAPVAVQIQHALVDEMRQSVCTHVVRNPE
jgi:hypothetical protein